MNEESKISAQGDDSIPRRDFIKKSAVGLLGLSLVDLIPSTSYADPPLPEYCNLGPSPPHDSDAFCGKASTGGYQIGDAACSKNYPGVHPKDPDENCGNFKWPGITDTDNSLFVP
jgi:hypothetical protein